MSSAACCGVGQPPATFGGVKKSGPRPFPVDVATFERLQAAGRVSAVRVFGGSVNHHGEVTLRVSSRLVEPHEFAQQSWSLERFEADGRLLRWAHDWPVGVTGEVAVDADGQGVGFGAFDFLPRDVSEAAWAVGELLRRFVLSRCSVAFLPAEWKRNDAGGLTFKRQELLDVSVVPNFTEAETRLERARREDVPLGWLKEWVEKVLDEAATSEEARLRLVCAPDQLAELHRALAAPAVQVPGDDDVLVAKVEALESALDRLTTAVQDQTAVLRQLAASGTNLTLTSDGQSRTPPPAREIDVESY